MKKGIFSDLKIINRIIFILSILGVLVAIYVLQSFVRQSSIVCVNTGCEMVRKSPLSYILGIPVPAFGLIGYTFLTLLAFMRTLSDNKNILWIMMGIAGGGVCFVTWFTYTEIFQIKAMCTWCGVSAVNMLIIFILILRSLKLDDKKSG